MLYKLVENNVAYAGEQFGENLRFNSEVLTNVLYDNIRKLIGNKVEEDEFANWLADELIKNGYILKQETPAETDTDGEQPKEEIVYAIEEKDYQDLLDRIHSALTLLQVNKPTISKLIGEVDAKVNGSNSIDTQQELMQRRDKEITELVKRIQGNQENIQTYIENHEQIKKEFAEKVLLVNKKVDEFTGQQQRRDLYESKLAIKTKDLLGKVGRNWQQSQEQGKKLQGQLQGLTKGLQGGV